MKTSYIRYKNVFHFIYILENEACEVAGLPFALTSNENCFKLYISCFCVLFWVQVSYLEMCYSQMIFLFISDELTPTFFKQLTPFYTIYGVSFCDLIFIFHYILCSFVIRYM